MLIISRKINDEILIKNGEIKIKVLRNDGRYVRLGVEAPSDIDIVCGEKSQETQVTK